MDEQQKIQKSVFIDKETLSRIEKIAEKRDRSVHYILIELIEKNIDRIEHAVEPTSETLKTV